MFWTQKVHVLCSCEAKGKNFPVFTLEPDRPCDAGLLWSTVVGTRNDDKSRMMMGPVLTYI